MKILGVQCYQDYNVCCYDTDTKELRYIELDKLLKKKHFSFHTDEPLEYATYIDSIYKDCMHKNIYKVQKIIKERLGVEQFDVVAWCYTQFEDGYLKQESFDFVEILENCKMLKCHHQENHILPTVIMNKLEDSLCLSIDGKGDGNHALYHYKDGKLKKIFQEQKFSYGMFYEIISCNFLESEYYDGMEGKFMAYAGISTNFIDIEDISEFLIKIKSFNWNDWKDKKTIEEYINTYINQLKKKFDKYDLAYTFQRIWINDVMEFIHQYVGRSDNLVFSGGCALNCMLNYELVKSCWFKNVYWNPVASDTGQSIGAVINYLFHEMPEELQYIDFKNFYLTNNVYDMDYFNCDISEKLENVNIDKIVDGLVLDKIYGVCRGNIEMGPRALGHRSILASPQHKEMHERLNAIKSREWYRPYGVLIPRECMGEYFDIDVDAPYMNVLGYCKKKGIIDGAIHLDGTVRIQTVSKEEDLWLYELLKRYGEKTGIPILINTSFNDNGMPIFNYTEDMYRMFNEKLDGLIFDEGMILK